MHVWLKNISIYVILIIKMDQRYFFLENTLFYPRRENGEAGLVELHMDTLKQNAFLFVLEDQASHEPRTSTCRWTLEKEGKDNYM